MKSFFNTLILNGYPAFKLFSSVTFTKVCRMMFRVQSKCAGLLKQISTPGLALKRKIKPHHATVSL